MSENGTKITEAMRAEVLAFERSPRTEILAQLLEATEVARQEPNHYRRAKALALIARTMMRLYPDDVLKGTAKPTRAQA